MTGVVDRTIRAALISIRVPCCQRIRSTDHHLLCQIEDDTGLATLNNRYDDPAIAGSSQLTHSSRSPETPTGTDGTTRPSIPPGLGRQGIQTVVEIQPAQTWPLADARMHSPDQLKQMVTDFYSEYHEKYPSSATRFFDMDVNNSASSAGEVAGVAESIALEVVSNAASMAGEAERTVDQLANFLEGLGNFVEGGG